MPDWFDQNAPKASAAPSGDWFALQDPNRKPASAEDFTEPTPRSALGTAADVGLGFLKGAGSTIASIGEMAANAGVIPGMTRGALFDPAMRHPAFTVAEDATTATNTPQRVGKGLETAAEILLPTGAAVKAAVNAIPSSARAASKFQGVMHAAKDIPLDVEAAGQVALRIAQLAERGGGSLPRPVSQFLQRITHPDKAPLAYEEARDFASGISKLSANESMRLTPALKREINELRATLNRSVGEAANKAGKGQDYIDAMTEYAKAMKLRGLIDETKDEFIRGARQALPIAGAVGLGNYLVNKLTGK